MYDTLQRNYLEEDKHNKNAAMKNFSHKKGLESGTTQVHVEPPPITLIKVKYGGKSEIPRQVNRTSLGLGYLCLTMAIQKSFLCVTST